MKGKTFRVLSVQQASEGDGCADRSVKFLQIQLHIRLQIHSDADLELKKYLVYPLVYH